MPYSPHNNGRAIATKISEISYLHYTIKKESSRSNWVIINDYYFKIPLFRYLQIEGQTRGLPYGLAITKTVVLRHHEKGFTAISFLYLPTTPFQGSGTNGAK
jgi:hypothetical protein